jgi:hypothetical protein
MSYSADPGDSEYISDDVSFETDPEKPYWLILELSSDQVEIPTPPEVDGFIQGDRWLFSRYFICRTNGVPEGSFSDYRYYRIECLRTELTLRLIDNHPAWIYILINLMVYVEGYPRRKIATLFRGWSRVFGEYDQTDNILSFPVYVNTTPEVIPIGERSDIAYHEGEVLSVDVLIPYFKETEYSETINPLRMDESVFYISYTEAYIR